MRSISLSNVIIIFLCIYTTGTSNYQSQGIPGIEIPNVDETKVVPIVTIIPGKIIVDVYAIHAILDKIGHSPFGIYSINGPSRTGKSYLLSRFVHYLLGSPDSEISNGFEWRGETDRCTRGINIWSEPLEVPLGNGSSLPLLLVDTQGCFDEKSPLELDAKLFAISTLLSSVQVFNTIRTVDEATLQFLEAFTGVASMCNTNAKFQTEANHLPDFQKLIVLIRDFQFRDYKFGYYDNTHQPKGEKKNFKIDKLNPQQAQPEAHQRIRLNILQSFQETAAFLMPHPGKELSMNDNPRQLDEDFKTSQDELIRLLFEPKNLIRKTIDGKIVTGLEFKDHVLKWTEVLEKIQNLKLPKTSEGASEIQYLTGVESARKEYLRQFDEFFDALKFRIKPEIIETRHKETLNLLSKAFDAKVLFRNQNENSKRFKNELEEWSRAQLSRYHKLNLENYEYWMYTALLAWKFIYPYLLYIMATLVAIKMVRWLIGL